MAFAAVGLACWGAVRRIGLAAPSVLVAPTAIAVMGMVQLFPRPDGLHLLSVGPLVLPIGMHLARRAGADLPRPWQRVAIGLCLLLAAARAAPTLWLAGRVVRGDLTMVQLGNERLWATPEGVPRLQAVATAVGVVRERAPANGTVLGFPGCAAVTFFADRPMAGPHDYFFPGRPSRVEVAELIDGWRSRPPPFAVTCSAAGTDLAAAWAAYPEMTAFLAERYTPIATASPFTVHEGHP